MEFYTIGELKSMSKSELIELIMEIQEETNFVDPDDEDYYDECDSTFY